MYDGIDKDGYMVFFNTPDGHSVNVWTRISDQGENDTENRTNETEKENVAK